ncbi:MAG: hypothetical protein AAFY46_03505, partial [Planctomycetota bacterium]
NPPTEHRGAIKFRPDLTLDGERIRPGSALYCRARLVPPDVPVRVIRQHRTTASWLDGRSVVLWQVDPCDGHSAFVIEPRILTVRRSAKC